MTTNFSTESETGNISETWQLESNQRADDASSVIVMQLQLANVSVRDNRFS